LYAVAWCVHHLLAVFWLWGLNLGHISVLTKEFDSAPVHPPPITSLSSSVGIKAVLVTSWL
jgi:hypothetical protein